MNLISTLSRCLKSKRNALTLGSILITAATLITPQSARAATDTITSLADDYTAGTLRAEIARATVGDTIVFQDGLTGTLTLNGTELLIEKDLTIQGPGADLLTISGNNLSRIFHFNVPASASGITVSLSGLTISDGFGGLSTGNADDTSGGGISNSNASALNISHCNIFNNKISANSSSGGGIYNRGSLKVDNSTFTGNSSRFAAGAIYNYSSTPSTIEDCTFSKNTVSGDADLVGGAIANSSVLKISGCLFSENTVTGTPYISESESMGGGVANTGHLEIKNCTLINNICQGSQYCFGGGLGNNGHLEVYDCTIFGNSILNASEIPRGGGIYNGVMAGVLFNTIVAGNISSGNYLPATNQGPDIYGPFTSSDYNFVQSVSGASLSGTHNITNFPAQLSSLANNGGPTLTMAPYSGSLVINAGDPAFDATSTPYDQRGTGYARVDGGRVDIGAFEGSTSLPTVGVSSVSQAEGDSGTSSLTLALTLSAASTQTVTVKYATADGTANAGADYTAASGTVTFAPGETSKSVTITVSGDTLYEADETFVVNLTNATNSTIAVAQGTETIANDDAAPTISINDVSVTEGNSGTSTAQFTVTQSALSGLRSTFHYTSSDNTAIAPGDYVATSGDATIPAGSSSVTIPVIINGDGALESDENFLLDLSSPANATLTDSEGIGTILNDEQGAAAVSVALSPAPASTNAVLTATPTPNYFYSPPAYTYVWKVGTTVKQSGSSNTYDLSAAGYGDSGQIITVTVTATSGDQTATTSATLTVANSAPTNVSVTPSPLTSNYGVAKSLTVVYSDVNGAADISLANIRVGVNNTVSNIFWGYYDSGANLLYLYDTNGSTKLGGFAPGSSNVINSSFGSLNCAATTVTRSGNTLTINWSLTPAASYTGLKNVFLFCKDSKGANSTTNDLGDWTITAPNVAPTNTSVTPSPTTSTAGTAKTLAAVYSDANGAADIVMANIRIGVNNTVSNIFWGYYDSTANLLYLYDTDGVTKLGGFAPGSANVITNSFGSLNCATTSVTRSGNALTINWSFTPTVSYTGLKNVFLFSKDSKGANSGTNDLGDWTIVAPNVAPTNTSVTPSPTSSSVGTAKTLTAVYSDGNGATDISLANIRVGVNNTVSNIFWGYYDSTASLLYLYDNDGVTKLGGFAPGSAHVISSSFGSLDCANTTISRSGNALTINWSLTPAAFYTGLKNVYLFSKDSKGANSGTSDLGDWTITAAAQVQSIAAPSGGQS